MQGMKSGSRKRGLGGAEGRYKRVGVDERRGVGRSGVTAGKRRHELRWSRVLERGDPRTTGPARLPALENRPGPQSPSRVNRGTFASTNRTDPTSSSKGGRFCPHRGLHQFH